MTEKVAYKDQQAIWVLVCNCTVNNSWATLLNISIRLVLTKMRGWSRSKMFSMTTKCKCWDQSGRTEGFHRIVYKAAALSGTALYELDDALEFSDSPLW